MRIAVTTAAMLLVSLPAIAQDEAARRAATEVAARVPFESPMKGAPYTADTVVEGTQTLADGNRIHRKTTGRVYRDGEGRTRREEERPNGTTAISIVDPIAGFSYSLDPENKIAWRTPAGVGRAIMGKIEAAQQPAIATRVEPVRTTNPDGSVTLSNRVTFVETTRAEAEKIDAERKARAAGAQDAQSRTAAVEQARTAENEKEKVEARVAVAGGGSRARGGGGGGFGGAVAPAMRGAGPAPPVPLENKVIDGLAVQGHKTTTVIPAGQIGNDQPITITSEQWRSTDLNVLVMTRHADPRTGESIYRLTNVIRAEPDPSLFMVPADYTVKDTGIRKMLESSMKKPGLF